ncbi:MAG TPA: porin [Flavobacterium sp.]
MKKYCIYLIIGLMPIITIGQVVETQTNEGNLHMTDSVKSLIPEVRQKLLRDMDVIFNTRMGYDSHFTDSDHTISKFYANQFRLELKGKIHDKVSFRFRNRYTKDDDPASLDHVNNSVDLALVKIDFTPKTSFSFGKLCAAWGGYEFDFNPIDIMAYNDIIQNADNFLMGAGISHTLEGGNHSFTFQVLNSRTKTYSEIYGLKAPPSINETEYPLAAVINWRGSFFDGKYQTTWSYNFFNEAKGAHMNYFTLGNKFKGKNFAVYYDFQYSDEGLDRKGIITRTVNNAGAYSYAAEGVLYIENWLRAEFLVAPKVTVIMSAFTSNHYWKENPDPTVNDKVSTSYGLVPTIEYMPFQDMNLRFFAGYVFRRIDYTSYGTDVNTGQLSVGIVAPLLVL